jgi:hypothetical protein
LDPTISHSPLCQGTDNQYGSKQFFAKAYPGLRELQVLRGFYEATNGDNSIVGSICPKDLAAANKSSAGYGYNPAVKSLVDRLKEKLGGTCLPRRLTVDPVDGTVPCAIVEAIPPQTKLAKPQWCSCEQNGRTTPSAELTSAIKGALQREAICGSGDLPNCNDFCFCSLTQLTAGSDLGNRCLTELNIEKSAPAPGYCYVDPSQITDPTLKAGAEGIVTACPGTEKRIIRIIGGPSEYISAPAPGRVFIACSGAAYQAQ